jgi:hypothetical protein
MKRASTFQGAQMSENTCDAFKSAMAAALASGGPIDPPMEIVRHLADCEACLEWFEGQDLGLPDGSADPEAFMRVGPLFDKLAQLEDERPPDPAREALQAEHDRREAEFRALVAAFVARHPSLAPEKHGIPMDRYDPLIFFLAVDGLNGLMRRYHRRDDRDSHTFALREDGAVFIDGREAIPLSSVRGEIRLLIRDSRIVPEEEKTPDLAEALRREAAWRDDETCDKLAKWVVAAICVKPDLMRNFRLFDMSLGSPQYFALEPIRAGTGERDHLDLWK